MRYAVCLFWIALSCSAAGAQEPGSRALELADLASPVIEYEVTLLHLPAMEPLSEKEQQLDGAGIVAAIPGWRKAGRIERLTTFRTRAYAGQPAVLQLGSQTATATSQSSFGGRGTQTNYSYVELGIMLQCTGRIDGKGQVAVELEIEESRLEPPAARTTPEPEEGGGGVAGVNSAPAPPERRMFTMQTTVAGPSGKPLVVGGITREGEGQFSTAFLVLTPKIVGEGP